MADMILFNGKITTMDPEQPEATAIALKDGLILEVGSDAAILRLKNAETEVIDLNGQRVIPGLIDSHTHIIRQGNNFAMELRWDHVPSLADGLALLKAQAQRTPAGQWIRVVGGWSADQFAEKRLPTIDEINAVAPEVPVYVLHLYDRAWLNKAALRALGIDKHFYEPFVSGRLERDDQGNPTGLAMARPNAQPLYALLDMAPKLDFEQQITSTKHYFRALNGLGLTSALDCAGGFLNYPDDYGVISELNKRGEQTVRIGYQLFAQRPLFELDDFKRWNDIVKPDQGNDYLKCVGAGEMLVASAYDFEDFSYPRPELPKRMEGDLRPVLEFLLENGWPIRFHCTYEESAHRLLTVLEEVGRDKGLEELNWIFDHGETISESTMEWVARMGGGISYQNRIAFQATAYRDRYGEAALNDVMPVKKMMASGAPLAAGTDATRVSSYNPWLAIHWAVSGKGRGGDVIWQAQNRLSRQDALQHWTAAGAWFSREQGKKGQIKAGQLADIAVLDRDYFVIPEDEIIEIEADLTFSGGKIVHAKGPFAEHAPAPLPELPDWSPVPVFGAPGASKGRLSGSSLVAAE
ncbi:amidohydrolase [Roseibium alexandrii]|uniref:N-substituted formamide deformylase n=1 Tax=Roseibium alexandrii TaxID=388408 RepID=A0A0M7A766_9HYPH|nr:amidohydrolase [Roseibium alexandrii]CTQ69474.1 N-substituted formamide deformylase precursor [Roseibium alexandrii]